MRRVIQRIGAVLSSLVFSLHLVFLCLVYHDINSEMKLDYRLDLCSFIPIMQERTDYAKPYIIAAIVCLTSAGLMALLLILGRGDRRTLIQYMLFPIPLIWSFLFISMLILDRPVLMIMTSCAIAFAGSIAIALLAMRGMKDE